MQTILSSLIFQLTIKIEYLYERISFLRKKQWIKERYTSGGIGAHGIQIRCEVGAHVLCFWTVVAEVKCLGYLHIGNIKKTVSTQLLIYIYV